MKKKSSNYQPTEITLTRAQVEKLAKLLESFKDISEFSLTETHESGIGPTVKVKLNLFENEDTVIDITDVSTW